MSIAEKYDMMIGNFKPTESEKIWKGMARGEGQTSKSIDKIEFHTM